MKQKIVPATAFILQILFVVTFVFLLSPIYGTLVLIEIGTFRIYFGGSL